MHAACMLVYKNDSSFAKEKVVIKNCKTNFEGQGNNKFVSMRIVELNPN
jgi:hypothetical protein